MDLVNSSFCEKQRNKMFWSIQVNSFKMSPVPMVTFLVIKNNFITREIYKNRNLFVHENLFTFDLIFSSNEI